MSSSFVSDSESISSPPLLTNHVLVAASDSLTPAGISRLPCSCRGEAMELLLDLIALMQSTWDLGSPFDKSDLPIGFCASNRVPQVLVSITEIHKSDGSVAQGEIAFLTGQYEGLKRLTSQGVLYHLCHFWSGVLDVKRVTDPKGSLSSAIFPGSFFIPFVLAALKEYRHDKRNRLSALVDEDRLLLSWSGHRSGHLEHVIEDITEHE